MDEENEGIQLVKPMCQLMLSALYYQYSRRVIHAIIILIQWLTSGVEAVEEGGDGDVVDAVDAGEGSSDISKDCCRLSRKDARAASPALKTATSWPCPFMPATMGYSCLARFHRARRGASGARSGPLEKWGRQAAENGGQRRRMMPTRSKRGRYSASYDKKHNELDTENCRILL